MSLPVSVSEHKHSAPNASAIRVSVVTVSDTRTQATDEGGRLVRDLCQAAGLQVVGHVILRDEPDQVTAHVRSLVDAEATDAILLTGGTGLSRRDSTVEAVAGLFDKTIDGYGELFRYLSFQDIGPAAMLSRATAGVIGGTVVFTMPGSPGGVRLALERLILPELGHVVSELRRHGTGHHHHGHHHKHRT